MTLHPYGAMALTTSGIRDFASGDMAEMLGVAPDRERCSFHLVLSGKQYWLEIAIPAHCPPHARLFAPLRRMVDNEGWVGMKLEDPDDRLRILALLP